MTSELVRRMLEMGYFDEMYSCVDRYRILDTRLDVCFNGPMNATTPQHPQPAYWFMVGRKLGQAGDWSVIDPSDYGRVFADDDPPAEWIDAVNLGIRQGFEDLMTSHGEPVMISQVARWRNRLADMLVNIASRLR